ncbi:mRNA-decapping enzyme 1B isoform B [Alligator mississippiensis]|uniref:5'-(N(7)-methylguanosine 5'-triphospho)-[mRNA] hydrolase n=1 Tax=Alligator mississippiensis TaxID=8496 RepID=A0A151NIH9_ALLMI|nr:mRNA-decapping enzyme 1B isoform B [Alligator mississippiensis]
MAAAAAGSALLGKGLDISLAALQQHDPYISSIVDVASQVALYTFGHRANEWEKTDVEGTLFVYTRSASPRHGFTIMNRLSMENRTEPITKDLDFQLQDPFLLYRNARLSIYGIWFYDKEECQRIAELMKNLTQQEQFKAQQGTGAGISPMFLNSGNSKEVDILRMLTKAKDEYTKCKTCSEPKQITSSSAIYDNPNLIKPIPVKPNENQHQRIPQQGKSLDSEPQHLSLTALFGKQEKPSPYQDVSDQSQKQHQEKCSMRQGVVRSLSYEEPSRHSPSAEKQLCPAIQKLMIVQQEQQLHVSTRPTLAAKFPVVMQSSNTLKLDSWIDKAPGAEKQSPLFQVISPQRIPATVTPKLLMSPMVFTQSTPAPPKANESGRLPPSNQEPAANSGSLILPMQNPEPSLINNNPMTKIQLQETLLHLIQNDDNFLNIIYEAYLFSVRKAAMKKSV